MKKSLIILSMVLFASSTFAILWTNGYGDQDFANPLNYHDLASDYVFSGSETVDINIGGADAAIISTDSIRGKLNVGPGGNSTGELFVVDGINRFASCTFSAGTDSSAYMKISGGDTTFTGYFTIGHNGYGLVEVEDGVLTVNRSQLSQSATGVGEYLITGGVMNVDTHLSIGRNGGQSSVTMTGGVLNVGTTFINGRDANTARGILNMSGDAVLNVLYNYSQIGAEGYAEINMNGGTINLDRVQFAAVDDPNSQGYLFMTDGEINVPGYFTVGAKGQAGAEISGGTLNLNRVLLGQEDNILYTANGYLTMSGGTLNIDNYLQVGLDGYGVFTLDGDAAEINCARLIIANGEANFVLNGAQGVGEGFAGFGGVEIVEDEVVVNDGGLQIREGGAVGVSFADGTAVAGDFVVVSTSERATYLSEVEVEGVLVDEIVDLPAGDATDLLTADSQTAGWTAALYNSGSGSAFVVTSPVTATKTAWASAGANDVAVIDDDTVTLDSAKAANGAVIGETTTATLDVAAGADGQFVNLTVGEGADSAGTVNISGGSVAVDSIAYIGKEGQGALNVSSGSFTAQNVIAATGDAAGAQINVSGDAAVNIGTLGLTNGSVFKLSGYQAAVEVGNLALDADANIIFELDENHGVGNGIVAEGNVVLDGIISLASIGERVDATYTIIRAKGEIFINRAKPISTAFVNYEIVENGEYNELQVTLFTPTTCEAVVNSGFGFTSDLNEDCYVNIEDFAIMATEWLTCNDPTDPTCELPL